MICLGSVGLAWRLDPRPKWVPATVGLSAIVSVIVYLAALLNGLRVDRRTRLPAALALTCHGIGLVLFAVAKKKLDLFDMLDYPPTGVISLAVLSAGYALWSVFILRAASLLPDRRLRSHAIRLLIVSAVTWLSGIALPIAVNWGSLKWGFTYTTLRVFAINRDYVVPALLVVFTVQTLLTAWAMSRSVREQKIIQSYR